MIIHLAFYAGWPRAMSTVKVARGFQSRVNIVQIYGRIDVLINNARLMPHSPFKRLKLGQMLLQISNFCCGSAVAAAIWAIKVRFAVLFIRFGARSCAR